MIHKLSSAQVLQVFAAVPGELRKLAGERDVANEKVAALEAELSVYKTRERATKVAQQMHEKHINLEVPLPDLVERLEKDASQLPEVERSLEWHAPGKLAEMYGTPDGRAGSTGSNLTDFLLGNIS